MLKVRVRVRVRVRAGVRARVRLRLRLRLRLRVGVRVGVRVRARVRVRVQQQGQSAALAVPQLGSRASSGRALTAPTGPALPGQRLAHRAPSHCLGCSS